MPVFAEGDKKCQPLLSQHKIRFIQRPSLKRVTIDSRAVRHMSLKQLYVNTIILLENHNIIGVHLHCIRF